MRQSFRREGKSYAEIIRKKTITEQKKDQSLTWRQKKNNGNENIRNKESTWLILTVNEEDMMWEKKGFIGCVKNANDIQELQQRFVDEGCNARFELFYLFNYLIEFRVFLNNLFDLWWCVLFLCYVLVF